MNVNTKQGHWKQSMDGQAQLDVGGEDANNSCAKCVAKFWATQKSNAYFCLNFGWEWSGHGRTSPTGSGAYAKLDPNTFFIHLYVYKMKHWILHCDLQNYRIRQNCMQFVGMSIIEHTCTQALGGWRNVSGDRTPMLNGKDRNFCPLCVYCTS